MESECSCFQLQGPESGGGAKIKGIREVPLITKPTQQIGWRRRVINWAVQRRNNKYVCSSISLSFFLRKLWVEYRRLRERSAQSRSQYLLYLHDPLLLLLRKGKVYNKSLHLNEFFVNCARKKRFSRGNPREHTARTIPFRTGSCTHPSSLGEAQSKSAHLRVAVCRHSGSDCFCVSSLVGLNNATRVAGPMFPSARAYLLDILSRPHTIDVQHRSRKAVRMACIVLVKFG